MDVEALHVAFLPWLAFGHLIPFLHLAIALATSGIRISYLSTSGNIQRLPKLPDHLTSRINFVEFPMPPVDGLPEGCESTMDVSLEQYQHLRTAYDLLQTPIKKFINQALPNWVIYDSAPYWMGPIARECGVRCINFNAISAAAMAFFSPPKDAGNQWWLSPESMTMTPDWIPFPSNLAFRLPEAQAFYAAIFSADTSGLSDMVRGQLANEGCEAMVVRTCNELEGEYLELLERAVQKPVIPLGTLPLPMPSNEGPAIRNGEDSWASIFRWLDGFEPKSVVFVSFGSEYKLTKNEVHELAHGLELSNLPFLWALRRPAWMTGDDEEVLPDGFTGRTEGRGMVSFGWSPYSKIFAHPSVGGCLIHCGWGSVVETLHHGHALVLLPAMFDQGLNARLLVEKGLGIEVERDEDGSFNKDKIARSLKTAMVSEEGEKLRLKTRKMGAKFNEQALQDKYVRKFIDYLFQARNKPAA